MKRFGEKFKQRLGIGGNQEWQPTSNKRNEAMEEEVRRFAQSLKQLHKMLQDLDTNVQGSLQTVRSVLMSPLPHAYDELPTGAVTLLDPQERLLGANVNLEALNQASGEMHSRLQHEVLLPLEQWLQEYRNAKAANRKCEQLRLDLDDKRRTTLTLHEKYEKQKISNHSHTEATFQKVQQEEDKLTRLAQRYAEKEAEVFNAFLRLIRDSAVLRDYAALALAILQRSFTAAYTAFDLSAPMQPPALPPPATVLPPQYSDATQRTSNGGLRISNGGSLPGSTSPVAMQRSATSSRVTRSSGGGNVPGALATSATFTAGTYLQAPPSPNHDPAGTLPPPAGIYNNAASTTAPYSTIPRAADDVGQGVVHNNHPAGVAAHGNGGHEYGGDGGKGANYPSWYQEHLAKTRNAKQAVQPSGIHTNSDNDSRTSPPREHDQNGGHDPQNPFNRQVSAH